MINCQEGLRRFRDIPLLGMRWAMAYGFYWTAKLKIDVGMEGIAAGFGEMGIPAPTLGAYLATGAEVMGVILLMLGLATRLIAVPLMGVMIVAISAAHWSNGFHAEDGGMEIPLYYLLMLSALLVFGPGRVSLDFLIGCSRRKKVE